MVAPCRGTWRRWSSSTTFSPCRGRGASALVEYILDRVDETGERPTALQTLRAGLNVGSARQAGGWFGLLHDVGVLTDLENFVMQDLADVLRQLEKEPLTKAYKLVVLRALLRDGTLQVGTTVERLAEVSRQIIAADPRLRADTESVSIDIDSVPSDEWSAYWRRNPVAAWTAAGKRTGAPLFRTDGVIFEPTFSVSADVGEALDDMVEELVEYRLARYLLRPGADAETIVLRVSHAGGRPMLFLDRQRNPETPDGWTEVIADGRRYELNFVKVAVNVARADGTDSNALPTLLRRWFGQDAGSPGTDHRVGLRQEGGRWTLAPLAPSREESAPLLVDGSAIDASAAIVAVKPDVLAVTFESAGGASTNPARATRITCGEWMLCWSEHSSSA